MGRFHNGGEISEYLFTAETRSSQSSEYCLIKNSLLRVPRASAVNIPDCFHHGDAEQAEIFISNSTSAASASPRCNLRRLPHRRDTEVAEVRGLYKPKLFTRRPRRLRGEFSCGSIYLE